MDLSTLTDCFGRIEKQFVLTINKLNSDYLVNRRMDITVVWDAPCVPVRVCS